MATNLRPRVESFDPFRPIRPAGTPNLDTYQAPDVDRSSLGETQSILAGLRGLSPSLDRYLERGFQLQQDQLVAEAEGAIGQLTPEEIRQESEKQWEGISRERGIDNPWWKIRMDEAAGRRLGLDFAERLTKRGLEASNPDDPQAHLRVLEEERAAATAGMNEFQRMAFEKVAADVSPKFVLSSATNRENRFQAKMAQSYRDDVRGLVREALDPALGGAVDLSSLRATVEAERIRSGNDGRDEVIAAIGDALTVAVARAGSDAELDAIRLQATALLTDLGAETFGGDAPLEEVEANRIAALESKIEQDTQARAEWLFERGERQEAQASDEVDDFSLGLAAKVFDGSLDAAAADEQLRAKVAEVSEKNGVDSAYLLGRGLTKFAAHTSEIDSTRFARESDPETYQGLMNLATGEDFNAGWFAVALEGARNEGRLSREAYATFLSMATNGVSRDAQKIAGDAASQVGRASHDRLIALAGPMLDSIPGAEDRDRAQALIVAEWSRAMASEREKLARMIQSKGLDEAAAAVDEWTADFLTRSGDLLGEVVRDVGEQLPGGMLDRAAAFRSRVQESPAYRQARQAWTIQYVAARLTEEEAFELGGLGSSGLGMGPADVAAMIAAGRLDDTARGFALRTQAEEAFLSQLEQQAGAGDPAVPVGRSVEEAVNLMRYQAVQPPPKPEGATKAEATAQGDQARQAVSETSPEARPMEGAAARLVQAQALTEQMRGEGRQAELIAEAERQEAEAAAEFDLLVRRSFDAHARVLESVSAGVDPAFRLERARLLAGREDTRDPMEKQVSAGYGIEVVNGRVRLKDPPRMRSGPWSNRYVGDAVATAEAERRIEDDFQAAKLWTGLTLEEVKAGKGKPSPNAPPESWISLDRNLISPAATPFFGSIAELDAADDATINAWLAEFPGYSREMFVAAQTRVILERIPKPVPAKEPK